MRVGDLCKDLINEIILDYDLPVPRVTNASKIDQQLLLQAFKAIVPIDPLEQIDDQYNQSSVYQCMVTSLSKSLNVDLSHINSNSLASGDLKHILSLLEILIAIKRFLLGNVRNDQLDIETVELEDFKCAEEEELFASASETTSANCSICFCEESTTAICKNVKDYNEDETTIEHKSKSRKQCHSPIHRLVDARKKKKLLMASKFGSGKQLSKSGNTSSSTSSSQELAKRLNQVLHLNEEVRTLETKLASNATSDSPDLIVDPCTLSPGTRIQLERLYKSHQAFQRNIRSQIEKQQDSRQLLLRQPSMHTQTGNSRASQAKKHQQVNHQMRQCDTNRAKSDTSMIHNVNPLLQYNCNYERDLRSRLARLTQEIKEREREIVSRKLKRQSQIQRHLVNSAKIQVNRSKKELIAAREYVLRRTLEQKRRDQIYLQSLEQLYDEKTDLLCAQVFTN